MNVYQIGVSMSMTNNVSGVLQTIARDLMGIHHGIGKANMGLASMRTALVGVGIAMGTVAAVKAGAALVEHGAKLQHYQVQFAAAGYNANEVAQATAKAWSEATSNANASVSETLKNIQHLTAVTGSLPEALHSISAFNVTQAALASLKDDKMKKHFEGDHLQTYNFARSLEMLGVTQNPEKLHDYVQGLTKTMIAFRGLVDGTQLYKGMQNAGGMQASWNKDFVMKQFPAMIQEMNAGRAANAVYMLQRGLGKGQTTAYAADAGIKAGLWEKDDKVFSNGRFVGMKANSIVGADRLNENPYKWIESDFLPTLKKHGYDTEEKVKGVLDELARNKTISQALQLMTLKKYRQQIDKEAANVERVPDDAAGILQDKDYSLAKKAVATQWDNMLQALGSPLVEPAIHGMKQVTELLQGITKRAIDKNSWFHTLFLENGGDLGATRLGNYLKPKMAKMFNDAMSFLGDMHGAGDRWAESLKPKIAAMWDKVKNAISSNIEFGINPEFAARLNGYKESVSNAINGISNAFSQVGTMMSNAIAGIPGMVSGAIAGMASSIGSTISNAISGIKGFFGFGKGGGASTPAPSKMNYSPPSGGAKTQAAQAGDVYMDGYKVGKHVARQFADAHRHVGGPSDFDSDRAHSPVDYSFA